MLTESYKKRIQELAGILLEDNTGKLKNFGISDDVAKKLVSVDDGLAMFFANATIRDFAKQEGIGTENLKETISVMDQGDFLQYLEDNTQRINYVLEWIKSPFRQGEINLKEIKDFSQAFEMADAWHRAIEATGIINDETGEIIKSYPKDGLYWIDLQTNDSRAESEAMGHCGKDSRATSLISLRDTKKSPHVTLGYNANTKVITQVKGRKNEKPIPQYMKYVYDLLRDFVGQGKLVDFVWSYGKDLLPEEIEYIFKGNLDVYIRTVLGKNMEQSVYTAPSFTREEMLATIGQEEYANYISTLLNKNLENPDFGLKLKRYDIIIAVGEERYKDYVAKLFDKIMENPRYKMGLARADVIGVVGNERYMEYVDRLLQNVLDNPINGRVGMPKDELFALLGEPKYKEFINNLVKKIVENTSVNTENGLQYVLNKHEINLTMEQVKAIVGSRIWFFFLKRANDIEKSNIRGSFY